MRGSGWPGAVSSWRERRTVPSPSGRVANKKPTQRNPPKETHQKKPTQKTHPKNPPKKTTKNTTKNGFFRFFWVFLNFKFFMKIILTQKTKKKKKTITHKTPQKNKKKPWDGFFPKKPGFFQPCPQEGGGPPHPGQHHPGGTAGRPQAGAK
jgi:hypothetical protein